LAHCCTPVGLAGVARALPLLLFNSSRYISECSLERFGTIGGDRRNARAPGKIEPMLFARDPPKLAGRRYRETVVANGTRAGCDAYL